MTVKNDASCSLRPDTATRNMARAMPPSVKVWLPTVRVAGLAPLRPHDLRHTAVALWIAAGANPKEVCVPAGHTSVAFALDRYGHLFEGHDDELRDRLDAMLAQGLQAVPGGELLELPAAPARPTAKQAMKKARRGSGLSWVDGGAPPGTRTPNRCLKRAFPAVA